MDQAETQPSLVGVAVRDLGRLRRVSTIVARHGFGELLMRTSLGRRLFDKSDLPDGDASLAKESPAVRLTKLLATLGPTYIKLGQILSMRKDLFSKETIDALEQLQDRAPALDFADIRAQVESGLGAPIEELYARFDEAPLATASIAQTHRALTHAGEEVVVKVQRPGIDQTMRSDLDLLYLGAQVLEASIDEMQLLGVSAIVEEFEKGLIKELNFQQELSNLLQFRQNLDPTRKVCVPRPHPELSCRTVLTMDFFRGKPLRALTPHTPEAHTAVEEVVHSACKQVFLDGLFHGDPHSGNILINDQGTLCMLDLGMVGRLSEDQRDDVVTLIIAAIANDSSTLARVLLKMGTPTQRVNIAELKGEIERMRSQFLTVGSLGDYDSAGFAEAFAGAAGRFRIKLAAEYAILIKAAATIEGIIRHLHPKIDLVNIAQPYAKQILARRFNPQKLLSDFMGDATGLGASLRTLPEQLDQVLHDFQTGNMQLRAVTPELDAIPGQLHQAASRVVLALFASSMTLATAVVLPNDGTRTLNVLLAVACALLATGAWTILFFWHWLARGKPVRVTPLLRFFRR